MFATGLVAAILLDATVIRALLVPAVVSLFGRWNWILPHRPARLLRVEPSMPTPAPEEAGRGTDERGTCQVRPGEIGRCEFSRFLRSNSLQGDPRTGGIEMSKSTAAATSIGRCRP